MKELEQHKIDKTEIQNIKPVTKEKQLKKSLIPEKGQKTYQLNLRTSVITEAEYDKEFVSLTGVAGNVRKQVIMQEDCIYCVAINFKNADRKFHKMLGKQYKKR